MKRITNHLRQLPKKYLLLIALAMIMVTPSIVNAGFYPGRPTKDWNVAEDRKGFDKVVFNSFTNTPYYGDERHFFDASTGSSGSYKDVLQNVKPGDEITLRTYVHNNGNQSLNGKNFDGPTVAKNAKVRIMLPTATAPNLRSISYISADNATPGVVSDTTEIKGSSPFNLEYVPGSAAMVNKAKGGAVQKLSDEIVKGGAPIGYDGANGKLPGCFQYQTLVYVKVKVKAPALDIDKKVKIGDGKYQQQVDAKPGDKVKWLVSFKNTGTSQINNTLIRDKLPNHLKLVEGSVKLFTSKDPNGLKLKDDDLFDTNGVNVGSFTAGSNGYINFETTVKSEKELPECVNTLRNVATSQADNVPVDEDDALVIVRKDCAPEKETQVVTPIEKGEAPPTELPKTGPSSVLAPIVGGSLISYAGSVLFKKRHMLLSVK